MIKGAVLRMRLYYQQIYIQFYKNANLVYFSIVKNKKHIEKYNKISISIIRIISIISQQSYIN